MWRLGTVVEPFHVNNLLTSKKIKTFWILVEPFHVNKFIDNINLQHMMTSIHVGEEESSSMGWRHFGLPGRTCGGTFDVYLYESLPKVTIRAEFKAVDSLAKLKPLLRKAKEKDSDMKYLHLSPTICYWELDNKIGIGVIYLDSRESATWTLKPNGKVYTHDKICVSLSLPEFLTRIEIENALWFKTHDVYAKRAGALTAAESAYLAHYDPQNKYIV